MDKYQRIYLIQYKNIHNQWEDYPDGGITERTSKLEPQRKILKYLSEDGCEGRRIIKRVITVKDSVMK
jgi:hypothetical protein